MSNENDEYQRHLYKEPIRCFVPSCKNNNIKNTDILFVPVRNEIKERWCQIVGRNCTKRMLHCCEKHLNFERDLENYEEWIAGAKPKIKLNAIPKNVPKPSLQPSDLNCPSTSSTLMLAPVKIHAAVQTVRETKDKCIMVKPHTKNQSTNFRARKITQVPSKSSVICESEESHVGSQSPSLFGTTNLDSTSSGKQKEEKLGRAHRMKMIKNKPKMYIGLPKNYFWILDLISEQYCCESLHLIMTLFKLKNNDTFARMSEEFEVARSTIKLQFEKTLPILATYFQNFIYLPSPLEIKKNLPLVFKIRFSNVICIIDCFEIQIEKPRDPIKQAQSWSQYKSCNTVKYLIGCTPAGLICFISKGFGGRISDKSLTEKSGLLDILPPNTSILADRGFKEIEAFLSVKNIKLIRPPSTSVDKKLTKKEVILTKVIASLRVHVERVIRRVREFHMLKPHSVVNHKHVSYLDDLVMIACGLINLQEPIIKES